MNVLANESSGQRKFWPTKVLPSMIGCFRCCDQVTGRGCDALAAAARYGIDRLMSLTTLPAAFARMPWALLAAVCLGMFAASCSGTTRAPLLMDMARDLETRLAAGASGLFVTTPRRADGPRLADGQATAPHCLRRS
jgi:hypothetical protein